MTLKLLNILNYYVHNKRNSWRTLLINLTRNWGEIKQRKLSWLSVPKFQRKKDKLWLLNKFWKIGRWKRNLKIWKGFSRWTKNVT